MRLLLIPSWFPSHNTPMAGRFVLDQAQALQRHGGLEQLAVLSWGHHDGALSLREMARSGRALRWRMRQGREAQWQSIEGLDCIVSPALSWTLNWRGGGVQEQLAACRRGLQAALQRWGGVDLLHAHACFPGGVIARQLGQEFGLPYVLTEHMSPFPFPAFRRADGRLDARIAPVFADAAAVLAVSPALAEAVRAEGLGPALIVPNVVDVSRFSLRKQNLPGAAPWVLLALGSLSAQKGFDLLLRALKKWNPPASEFELRIGGAGPQRAALQALARELGLQDRVRWLGALHPDAVPAVMAQADAFVCSSRHETFGVVLAEAMASGLPVLATRCGGPEYVLNEHAGLLVDKDDVDALAEGLRQLRARAESFDPGLLRQQAYDRFGPEAVAGQLLQVYRTVLGGKGAAHG